MASLPALEWQSDYIRLGYLTITWTGLNLNSTCAGERANVADLPCGFRALWLRSEYIVVGVAKHSAGAALTPPRADFAAQDDYEHIHGANELCRFLSLAPASYEELRLFAVDEQTVLTVATDWCVPPSDVWGGAGDTVAKPFKDLPALAAALRRTA